MNCIFRTLCCLVFLTTSAQAQENTLALDIATCLDSNTPHAIFADPNGISLRPARIIELDGDMYFVHGSLGWHTTWAMLFDLSNTPQKVFETYGSKGDIVGTFGRMEVPELLSSVLVECGYEWGGLWDQDWPEEKAPLNQPDVDQDFPLIGLPINELLPPSQ